MPNVIVLEGGAFERCLIHEGGAFMTATSVLIRDPTETPRLSYHMRTQQEGSGYEPGKTPSPDQAGTLISDFQTAEL